MSSAETFGLKEDHTLTQSLVHLPESLVKYIHSSRKEILPQHLAVRLTPVDGRPEAAAPVLVGWSGLSSAVSQQSSPVQAHGLYGRFLSALAPETEPVSSESDGETICMAPNLLTLLNWRSGVRLRVQFLGRLLAAEQIFIRPVTNADWTVASAHASWITENALNAIRVVEVGQTSFLALPNQSLFRFIVQSINGTLDRALIGPGTEFIIQAPKISSKPRSRLLKYIDLGILEMTPPPREFPRIYLSPSDRVKFGENVKYCTISFVSLPPLSLDEQEGPTEGASDTSADRVHELFVDENIPVNHFSTSHSIRPRLLNFQPAEIIPSALEPSRALADAAEKPPVLAPEPPELFEMVKVVATKLHLLKADSCMNMHPSRGVLITGRAGSGKSIASEHLARRLAQEYHCATIAIQCHRLMHQSSEKLLDSLSKLNTRAIILQPCCIQLQNIDHLVPNSVEGQDNSEVLTRVLTISKALRDLRRHAVVVVGTADSNSSVHASLHDLCPTQLFDHIIPLTAPSISRRGQLLEYFLAQRFDITDMKKDSGWDQLILRMKDFNVGDISRLSRRVAALLQTTSQKPRSTASHILEDGVNSIIQDKRELTMNASFNAPAWTEIGGV